MTYSFEAGFEQLNKAYSRAYGLLARAKPGQTYWHEVKYGGQSSDGQGQGGYQGVHGELQYIAWKEMHIESTQIKFKI